MADRLEDEAEQEVAVDDHEADESDEDDEGDEDGLADQDEREESDEDGQDDEDEVDSFAVCNAISQLEAGAQELDLTSMKIGAAGSAAIAGILATNTTLKELSLIDNQIGTGGARSLAAALHNNATLTYLGLWGNDIGDEGARSLAAALDTNRVLQHLSLGNNGITADIENLVKDRLRVNRLVPLIASWVASAVARRVELWEDTLVLPPALAAPLVLPPAVAARAAVLAFGDELLELLYDRWGTPGGRDFAAAYLLPRAEASLRQELQRLADAAKRAHHAQSSSPSGSRAI
jgi:hypothetical protein